MKKMVAGAVLCLLVFVGFLGFQVSEKSKQKEFYQEAAVFFEEADYKKAIQYLEEAKEHSNLFTGSLEEEIAYYQAESHMNLEEYEEAIAIYDSLIKDNPKESMNYVLKEYCLSAAGETEKAVAVYQEAYERTGDEAFLSLLCDLYISMEQYDEALNLIEKSDQIKNEDVKKNLGFSEIVIYEKQQEYGKAFEKAKAYCELYLEDEKGQKERDFLESRK